MFVYFFPEVDMISQSGAKHNLGKQNVSGFWSSVTRFFSAIFCFASREIVIHCIRMDQISHVQSMVAKRGLTNQAKRSYPYLKKVVSTLAQHSTAEFQSIQQFWRVAIFCYVLQGDHHVVVREKIARGSEATRAETRNRRLVFWPKL